MQFQPAGARPHDLVGQRASGFDVLPFPVNPKLSGKIVRRPRIIMREVPCGAGVQVVAQVPCGRPRAAADHGGNTGGDSASS